jgi:hypothetical protein
VREDFQHLIERQKERSPFRISRLQMTEIVLDTQLVRDAAATYGCARDIETAFGSGAA